MINIICGTNRKDAITLRISEIYREILHSLGQESTIIDLNKLPSDFAFSALYENSGKNEAFNTFRQAMSTCQKYVFIVPEYNGSFPGVLKTFIDGLEYPNTFTDKKCALVGLSSGIQGGALALSHLTDIFNYCGMNVLAQKPKLARIEANMEDKHTLTNAKYLEQLTKQAQRLIAF